MDLANIVLIFGDIKGVKNVFDLAENRRFEFHPPTENNNWKGTNLQAREVSAPYFSMVMGENMFNPAGWILGSEESDMCDVQIASDNKTGVSRRHLRIDLSPDTHCPRMTNLSRNAIRVLNCNSKDAFTLCTNDHLEILSAVIIDFGAVQLTAWRPKLSLPEERTFRINAQQYSKHFLDARLIPSSSAIPTGQSTFHLRFGKDGAVYARDDPSATSTGSFASVFKVKELRSHKVFAAKMPHFRASDAPSTSRKRWESLIAEFRTMTVLRHPNIVQAVEVLDGNQPNEPSWLIMEWIPSDLDSFSIRDEDIPQALMDISAGLAFMHQAGRSHRDLKPANILIVHSHGSLITAKIADFGTAKQNFSGIMQTFTGSSAYMAPEFWEIPLGYTNSVDMWSFGVLALQLLTSWSVKGWDAKSRPTKGEHQVWIDQVLLPRIKLAPRRFGPLLKGLLEIAPERRWSAVKSAESLRT